MRNWEMRARAGNEEGSMGLAGGRVNSCMDGSEEPVGTYVTKR